MALLALFLAPSLTSGAPELFAKMESLEQGFTFRATYDQDRDPLIVTPETRGTLSATQSPEHWAIGADSVPVSLELLSRDAPTETQPAFDLAAGVTLAVSLEPLDGSPTGAPTRPVLSAGVLSDV